MATYQTEQKKLLIEFLKRHGDKAFTIDEIADQMKNEYKNSPLPGKSTVYRLMPKLCGDGLIKKFTKDNSRKSYYQIVDGKDCISHLHLKCTSCGKLVHLSVSASEAVLADVLNNSDFSIDKKQTVLFGKCSGCK